MQRLHHSTLKPLAASATVLVLVVGSGLAPMSKVDAQRITQAISVAVVPFVDHSRARKELLGEKAMDAVALALDESREYVVSPKADTRRELENIGAGLADGRNVALSLEQMVRLGERLRVDKVCNGSVDRLTLDGRTGRARCVLTVRLLDVTTHEYLDGATSDYTTRPIPGWKGDQSEVINEVLRSAAEDAVTKILTSRRPRGNVDLSDQDGTILVNLGARDGIDIGTQLLVVRGLWNEAEERVVVRKIGIIEVRSRETNMSRCRLVSGSVPRTGDKCYVMYRPTRAVAAAASKARTKSYLTILGGVLAAVGLYNVATGPDSRSAPGARAFLAQQAPGSEPRIRVETATGSIPGAAKTHAWLVFRGDTAGFPAQVDNRNYLVAAIRGSKLIDFEDDPRRVVDIGFELEFQYMNEEGDREDGSVDITYNHLELTAGSTYYYKLRRIVDPGRVRIPIADTTQAEDELVDVSFDLDPADALSEESAVAGPVTFIYPVTLQTPTDGNAAVDGGAGKTVFTWTPSLGADEYQVMIYTNPGATGTPVKLSPVITFTGSGTTMSWRMDTALAASTKYYWFVGARKRGEAPPFVRSLNRSGWIMSAPFSFTTAPTPPITPLSAGGPAAGTRPGGRSGWWGETPMERKR